MTRFVIWIKQDCDGVVSCGYLTSSGELGARDEAQEYDLIDAGDMLDSCDYEDARLVEARVLLASSPEKLIAC